MTTDLANQIADHILKAAGSGLSNYTMPMSRAKILAAASAAVLAAQAPVAGERDAALQAVGRMERELDKLCQLPALMLELLQHVDQEVEERKHSGNDEDYAALEALSTRCHDAVAGKVLLGAAARVLADDRLGHILRYALAVRKTLIPDPEADAIIQSIITAREKALAGHDLGKVVVEVRGGVAEITSCPAGVDAEIIDHDNQEDGYARAEQAGAVVC